MFGDFSFSSQATLRGGMTRGRIGGSMGNLAYPNPFFDVAQTYLPTSVKELFKHCKYQYETSGPINTICHRFAEYPITDILIEHPDARIKKKWLELLQDQLQIRTFQVDAGGDYMCYGNQFTTISYPFVKHLTCRRCGMTDRADKLRSYYQFSNYDFRLTCPRCGYDAPAGVSEVYYRDVNNIRLVRISPESMELTHNDITGMTTYYFQVPPSIRGDIVVGKRDIIETTPQIFIQALREQKGIIWQKSNFYHMKRPTIAFQDRGWGMPLILPVLKDAFQLQLLKKACEAILLEHIIPLRAIFPQAGSGSTDPFTTINLSEWREQMAAEIARWRMDPSYIPILPLPIGTQTLGGDGKAILLFQEVQNQVMEIVKGMGAPREFYEGGLSWSGSNVSLRMLENNLLGYMSDQRRQLAWIIQSLASYLEWPVVRAKFKPFKMADDLQRKMQLLQLFQVGELSGSSLLEDSDYNRESEQSIRRVEAKQRIQMTREEQLANAELAGESQVIAAKYQAAAQLITQKAMAQPPAPGEPGVAIAPQGPEQVDAQAAASEQAGASAMQQSSPGQQGMPLDPNMQIQQGPPATDANLGGMPQESQNLLSGRRLQPGQQAVSIPQLAGGYAATLAQMDPQAREQSLKALQQQNQELASLVIEALKAMGVVGGAKASGSGSGVDTRPLPEQRAPRRKTPSV